MDRLRADNDLVTVTAPVDAHLEIAEIHRRVIAAGGPAVLFTNVKGRAFPVVTNLFGTQKRAALAFGRSLYASGFPSMFWSNVALPPMLESRARGNLRGCDVAIFGWMPFVGDGGKQ